MNDLATSTPQTLAVAGPSVDSMIMAGIDKGITPDGLEKLCKLKMMMDAERISSQRSRHSRPRCRA